MNPQIAVLIEHIRSLEAELDAELAKRRADLRIGLEHGRIIFEQELLRRHRELQVKLSTYLANARPLVVLTAPVIYSLIVPIVLIDLCMTIYQAICFPVYGIAKVRRGDYFVFDRAHLAYLNAIEKLHCLLHVCERRLRLYPGNRVAHRGILVPHQARPARRGNARALLRI